MSTFTEEKTEGQIPCVLVYSDKKHVSYIFNLINYIEELLPELGFRVFKLSSDSPADTHLGEYFEKLIDECIVGLVILDGFRPNILFEYGLLRGKEKIVVPIQDKKAKISVKSLYSIFDISDNDQVQQVTGLTKRNFNRLIEPPIGYFDKLSDRHGIKIINVDCDAELNSEQHPKQKIRSELKKLMPEIREKYSNKSLMKVKEKTPQFLKEFQEITLRLLKYYTLATSYQYEDVRPVIPQINKLETESGVKMPLSIYNIIASLHESLAEKEKKSNNIPKTILNYRTAIKLYERTKKDAEPSEVANSNFRLGAAYQLLSDVLDKEINLGEAIKAFEKALTVQTKDAFPIDYARTQNNLGYAYSELSEVRAKESNVREAIKAFEKALTVQTKDAFPIDYARTQNNLGGAYSRLSGVRAKESNVREAIKAFEKALTVFTKDSFPVEYAATQNNLGNAYVDFSEVRNNESNVREAIKAFEKALVVYTKDAFPIKYAMTQNNLGIAYGRFSSVNAKELNVRKAIKAFKRALAVQTKDAFPVEYAKRQINLGNAYIKLAELENNEKNIGKAIKAYKEALAVYTEDAFPNNYARIQNNLGSAYAKFSFIEDAAENLGEAIKAFEKALTVYTKDAFPIDYARTQNNLGGAYYQRSWIWDKDQNLKDAIRAYDEALSIYTEEKYPSAHLIVKNNLTRARTFM